MRTTLTIDDTLAAALKKKAYENGKSFKEVVNEALAAGLQPSASVSRKPYKTKTFKLGEPTVDLVKANQLAGELEDQELIRKLELRK